MKGVRPAGTTTTTTANPTSNGSGDHTLASLMASILTNEDGAMDMADFPAKLLEICTLSGVKGTARVKLTKAAKDASLISAAAVENGFVLDGLSIAADGKMSGTLSTE